jgi:hypothetical protein
MAGWVNGSKHKIFLGLMINNQLAETESLFAHTVSTCMNVMNISVKHGLMKL